MLEQIFAPRPPVRWPEILDDFYNRRHDEMPLGRPHRFEDVDAHDPRVIRGRVQENDIVRAGAGNDAQEIGNERAVRVDDGESHTAVKVGESHVVEQGGLADARLSKEDAVLPPHRFGNRDDRAVLFACAEMNIH